MTVTLTNWLRQFAWSRPPESRVEQPQPSTRVPRVGFFEQLERMFALHVALTIGNFRED